MSDSESAAGLALKAWREGKGLSQSAAGDLLGVTQVTVSDWESGRKMPRTAAAFRIQDVTGVPARAWTVDASVPEKTTLIIRSGAAAAEGDDAA